MLGVRRPPATPAEEMKDLKLKILKRDLKVVVIYHPVALSDISQHFRWKLVRDCRRRWTGQPCCYFPSYFWFSISSTGLSTFFIFRTKYRPLVVVTSLTINISTQYFYHNLTRPRVIILLSFCYIAILHTRA